MMRRRFYTVALSLVLIGLAVPFCLRPDKKDWDNSFIPAAMHLRAGESIYQDGYVYPPFMAWLAVPFSHAPGLPGKLAFYLVNVVAIIVILRTTWRLTGGGRLEGDPPVPLREHVMLALGLLTGIYYALDAFSNQQVDLVIAAALLLGCGALVARRELLAGVWIGLAAAMKTTPLLFVPYLLWRGWWRTAMCVIVVAVSVNILPDITHPPADGVLRLRHWAADHVAPLAESGHPPVMWFTGPGFNHSVAGVTSRWLQAERVWRGDAAVITPRSNVSATTLKFVTYMICAALLGAVVSVMRARPIGPAMLRSTKPAISPWTMKTMVPISLARTWYAISSRCARLRHSTG